MKKSNFTKELDLPYILIESLPLEEVKEKVGEWIEKGAMVQVWNTTIPNSVNERLKLLDRDTASLLEKYEFIRFEDDEGGVSEISANFLETDLGIDHFLVIGRVDFSSWLAIKPGEQTIYHVIPRKVIFWDFRPIIRKEQPSIFHYCLYNIIWLRDFTYGWDDRVYLELARWVIDCYLKHSQS